MEFPQVQDLSETLPHQKRRDRAVKGWRIFEAVCASAGRPVRLCAHVLSAEGEGATRAGIPVARQILRAGCANKLSTTVCGAA